MVSISSRKSLHAYSQAIKLFQKQELYSSRIYAIMQTCTSFCMELDEGEMYA